MKRIALAIVCACAFAACVEGAATPVACKAGETNRCSCAGGSEGVQQCLASGDAFGACVCPQPCPDGTACVPIPALIGMDIDQAGAAVEGAGLRLPDPVDAKGFITVQQVANPAVQVLDQNPPAGTLVKPGTQLTLTVTLPPDQESFGFPNSHFLVGHLPQDDEASAERYYEVLDPGPFPTRATLEDWKAANGFGTPADAEASAVYMTHTDLGFGRHMHMRRKGKHVAFYVDNYPTIEDAIAGTRFFATVAMEYSPGPNGKETDPFFTQFYVFNKKGERIVDPILDDHPPKFNPTVCLVCHGGVSLDHTYANGGNLSSRFIPFDLDAESFLDRPGYRREDQEAAFKAFNEAVQVTWKDAAADFPVLDPPAVPDLIDKWYGGAGHPSPTFISGVTPDGWKPPIATIAAQDLYQKVFSKACQTCHAQRDFRHNFSTFGKFAIDKGQIMKRVFEDAAMPLSERGYLNFWLSYPNQPKILWAWLTTPTTPFSAPGGPVARISVLPKETFLTPGTQIVLDASDSQYATDFSWSQLSGPPVELAKAAPDGSRMTFVAPPGVVTRTFQLVVSADGRNSPPATAQVLTQGPPGAPSSVTAVAGNRSATVSWTAPASNGNTPIQSYSVIASPGDATVSGLPTGSTHAFVSGLDAGTSYVFTVVATNTVGDSPASSASNPVTVFANPGAPTGVSATRGDGQVSLSWNPPADTGGVPISRYLITGSPQPAIPIEVPAPATQTSITGLTNGVRYVFTVVADNGAQGAGAPSNAVTPATIPGAPGIPAATPGDGSATVTWTAPDDGGDRVSSYTVVSSPGNVSATVLATPGAALAATLNGFANGVTYTFTVTAANGVGSGSPATTNSVLPSPTPGAPSQPQNVVAAFAGVSQTATVSWSPPADAGNSALIGYRITGIPGPTDPVTVGPSVTSTAIPGLTGGFGYAFAVEAINSAGAGPGAVSNQAAIEGPPQAPALASLVPGFVSGTVGSLEVSWSTPSNDGGSAITGYVITTSPAITPVNLGVSNSVTLSVADGLSRCTQYTVQVAAQNAWGTGPASDGLSAFDALPPDQMDVPGSSVAAAAINLRWTAPADRGCPIDQYTFASSPAGLGGTSAASFTSASVAQNTCAYASSGGTATANCARAWSFQVQAHNAAGAGALSPSTPALRPLVSYGADGLPALWTASKCIGCHKAGGVAEPLHLDGTAQNSLASIEAHSPPVTQTPVVNSYLLACGLGDTLFCPLPIMTDRTPHFFSSPDAPEYRTIQQWIGDGKNP